MAIWSPFDEFVEGTVNDLHAAIVHVLGARLHALHLYASLVVGDFDEGISDVDLLPVTNGALKEVDVEALREMHDTFVANRPDWIDRVEVAYVPLDDLQKFRTTTTAFPIVSPGEPFYVREEPLADWTANWFLIREASVALVGQPTSVVLPHISRAEFLDAVRRYVAELEEHASTPRSPGSESYIILTTCRALHSLERGGQTSKRAAGLWMQETYPEWSGLIDQALEWRYAARGLPPPVLDETIEVLRFVGQRWHRRSSRFLAPHYAGR